MREWLCRLGPTNNRGYSATTAVDLVVNTDARRVIHTEKLTEERGERGIERRRSRHHAWEGNQLVPKHAGFLACRRLLVEHDDVAYDFDAVELQRVFPPSA